jgi:hypothetical protein
LRRDRFALGNRQFECFVFVWLRLRGLVFRPSLNAGTKTKSGA